MIQNYSEYAIFTEPELDLFVQAQLLMLHMPQLKSVEELRCHEVARAMGHLLELPVQDGKVGAVQHSWLWTGAIDRTTVEQRRNIYGEHAVNILDVYVVGRMPPVQLVNASIYVHRHEMYKLGLPRNDIDEDLVHRLIDGVWDAPEAAALLTRLRRSRAQWTQRKETP